ncbi:MAG: CO dehydrogenase/acetyl-CoA synthase complex subunit alpha [Candidatus Hydrothermarchaeales archaeon]
MIGEKKIKIDKLESGIFKAEDLIIEVGEIEEYWDEPMGPTPMPGITDLRDWDFRLLRRYEPLYSPLCDMCCFCAYGKCDLTREKRGACGIEMKSQQARMVALESVIGAACHGAHARHMLDHQIEMHGRDFPIDLGDGIEIEAPIYRTVIGSKPKTLGDLEKGMAYAEEQISHVLASIHPGQEGDYTDRESKAMHAGVIDNLVMEIGDIAQIIGYSFPTSIADTPLIDLGVGTLDRSKPIIGFVGHNVMPAAEVISHMEENDLMDDIELCGICCTSHDMTRRNKNVKIVGNLARQMKFIKSGIADVVMIDEQCIREDILDEAERVHSALIATNDKMCMGLEDRTDDPVSEIVEDLVSGKKVGALILDPFKAGEVATKVAQKLKPKRREIRGLPTEEEVIELADRCTACEACQRVCPVNIHISEAMTAASKGDLTKFLEARELCVGCMRCDYACETNLPITKMMEASADKIISEERFKIRCGRGPIQDVEIRNVGRPIVFGEIPGIVVFAGCSNYPHTAKEVAMMAEEFLKRRFIVVTSGCAAMSIAELKDEEGKSLYEKYPGDFDAGCLVNLGSCLTNSHAVGAAIKVANIFAKRNTRGNFEEIADYIYNRIGAVAVVWGTYSQKALAICNGVNRWGIPVIYGPQGVKYRRLFLGRRDRPDLWQTYNAKTGDLLTVEPVPEHLVYTPETVEEAIVWIAKLCFRVNDTEMGRQTKLTHYIDLHKKYFGKMPEDVHLYVRTEKDLPITMKADLLKIIKKKGWEPRVIPDPTLVPRLVRVRRGVKE